MTRRAARRPQAGDRGRGGWSAGPCPNSANPPVAEPCASLPQPWRAGRRKCAGYRAAPLELLRALAGRLLRPPGDGPGAPPQEGSGLRSRLVDRARANNGPAIKRCWMARPSCHC